MKYRKTIALSLCFLSFCMAMLWADGSGEQSRYIYSLLPPVIAMAIMSSGDANVALGETEDKKCH